MTDVSMDNQKEYEKKRSREVKAQCHEMEIVPFILDFGTRCKYVVNFIFWTLFPMKEQLAKTWWNFDEFHDHFGMMVKTKISSTLQTIAYTSFITARLRRWLTATATQKKLLKKATHLILLNSFIQNRDSFLNISLHLSKKNKYYTCSQLCNAAT